MINAGAIVTTSLIKKGEALADRYDFVLNEYKKLAGGAHVGFNNATFVSFGVLLNRYRVITIQRVCPSSDPSFLPSYSFVYIFFAD